MSPNDFTFSDWNTPTGMNDGSDDDPWAADGEPVGTWSGTIPTTPAPTQPAPTLIRPAASREVLPSKLVRYRGSAVSPAEVAAFCQQWAPLHVIRNPLPGEAGRKAAEAEDADTTAEKDSPEPVAESCLFGWFPPEVLALASPVLISGEMPHGTSAQSPREILQEQTGQDNIVGVISPLPHLELAKHLRSVIRAGDGRPDAEIPQQVVMIYTPAGVRSVLGLAQQDVFPTLFDHVSAMIVEGEPPHSWELFCGDDFDRVLKEQFLVSAA